MQQNEETEVSGTDLEVSQLTNVRPQESRIGAEIKFPRLKHKNKKALHLQEGGKRVALQGSPVDDFQRRWAGVSETEGGTGGGG